MNSLYPARDQVETLLTASLFSNVRLLMSCSKTSRPTVMTQSAGASRAVTETSPASELIFDHNR